MLWWRFISYARQVYAIEYQDNQRQLIGMYAKSSRLPCGHWCGCGLGMPGCGVFVLLSFQAGQLGVDALHNTNRVVSTLVYRRVSIAKSVGFYWAATATTSRIKVSALDKFDRLTQKLHQLSVRR
jgi:hypothetical protein